MAKLVHIASEAARGGDLIALDDTGEVWRGEIKSDRSGEYIEWTHLRSEFSRR
jgi:hypothetical protein